MCIICVHLCHGPAQLQGPSETPLWDCMFTRSCSSLLPLLLPLFRRPSLSSLQNCTPPRSNSAFTSSRTHQNPSGTLLRPVPNTYHSLYHINKPLPAPHALRVEPATVVISLSLSPTMTSTPTPPQSHSLRACMPDTVVGTSYTLAHFTLTATLGTMYDGPPITPTLWRVYYSHSPLMKEYGTEGLPSKTTQLVSGTGILTQAVQLQNPNF